MSLIWLIQHHLKNNRDNFHCVSMVWYRGIWVIPLRTTSGVKFLFPASMQMKYSKMFRSDNDWEDFGAKLGLISYTHTKKETSIQTNWKYSFLAAKPFKEVLNCIVNTALIFKDNSIKYFRIGWCYGLKTPRVEQERQVGVANCLQPYNFFIGLRSTIKFDGVEGKFGVSSRNLH